MITVIAAIIVVGLVSWGTYTLVKPGPSKLPEGGVEEEELVNWKTYRNEEYGYEVRYPNDWRTAKCGATCYGFGPQSHPEDVALSVKVISLSLLEAKKSLPILSNPVNKVIKEEIVTINNTQWTKLIIKQDISGTVFINYLKEQNGKTYDVGVGTDDSDIVSIFNQILSTFKFIEPDESADWEIYRNETYVYEIKLPAEWKAYSEYDGSVIADSPENFPDNPLILTGTPPSLNFQAEAHKDIALDDYRKSFLEDAQQVSELQTKSGHNGVKLIKEEEIFFLVQIDDIFLKIYSSDSKYEFNDEIFKSINLIDGTTNWKTYRNEEYGYEVRYPGGWEISELPSGLTFHSKDWDKKSSYINIARSLTSEWASGYPEKTIKSYNFISPREETVIIDNIEAWKISGIIDNEMRAFMVLRKGGFTYELTAIDSNEIINTFNQILSTFKFID